MIAQLEAAHPAHKSAPLTDDGVGRGPGESELHQPGRLESTDRLSPAPVLIEGVAEKSPAEMRAKIMELEAVMAAMPERQIEIPLQHYYAPGLYLREIRIPKGATLTGKIHKTEHMCILSQGEVTVWNGEGTMRIQASTVVHSKPGVKRAIFAHEDSVWINVHHNPENETDPERIEERLIAKTFEEALGFTESKHIEGGN